MTRDWQDGEYRTDKPQFEMLEERIMLTSLVEGEFFVYLNEQQQAIRVDLNDYDPDTLAAVELFSWVDDLGLTDLPGIKNGGGNVEISPQSIGLAGVVNWPDGENILENPDGGGVQWNQNPTPGGQPPSVETWAVYVASASESTSLTFTNLATSPQSWGDTGWMNAIDPYGTGTYDGQTLNIALSAAGGADVGLTTRADDVAFEFGVPQWGFFPGGDLAAGVTVSEFAYSGSSDHFPAGVNIDAMTAVYDALFDLTTYYAVEQPFGSLGISDYSEVGLGENDAPVANIDFDSILDALVANDIGDYYAIDSDIRASIAPEVGYDEDDNGVREAPAWSLVEDGDTARGLALSDDGTFYYMQEGADLRHITRDGLLDISGDPGGDLTSLSFWHDAANPAVELLYGVYQGQNGGTLVTIGGPEDATGLTEVPVVNIMPFDDDGNGTIEAAEGVGYLPMELIAWPENPSDAAPGGDDQLYGVSPNGNRLFFIDPAVGGLDGNVYAFAYNPVNLDRTYEDITCIGGQLYGATADNIYRIDAATGVSMLVASPIAMLKQQVRDIPGVNVNNSQMMGMAYHDGNSGEHGALWVVYQLPDLADGRARPDHPVEYHLVRVDLGGTIAPIAMGDDPATSITEQVGSAEPQAATGVTSPWGIAEQYDIDEYFQDELPPVVSGLAYPAPPDVSDSYAYREIRAAAHDPVTDTYFAVATIFDMDLTDGDDTGNFALITIEADTGVATFIGTMTDFVTALEFDAAGTLYGADSTGDIQGIDPTTGAFTGSVNSGFVGMAGTVEGLAYVNANGNIGMLAVFSPDPGAGFRDFDQVWAVDTAGSNQVYLLYDNDNIADDENDTVMRDGLTSLAYSDIDGNYLWSTAPDRIDDGIFRLQRLPITALLVQATGDDPQATLVGPLYEPTSGLPIAEVTGLDDNVDISDTGLDPWLWAVGKEADLNPWDLVAPGDPAAPPYVPVDPAGPAPNVIAAGASIMELDTFPFFGTAVTQFHTIYDDVLDDGTLATDPDIFTNVSSLAFLPQDLDDDEPPIDIMYIVAEDPDFPGTFNVYDIEYSPIVAETLEAGFLRDDNDVDNFLGAILGLPETGPYDIVQLVGGVRTDFVDEVTGLDFAYNAIDPVNDFFESFAVAVDVAGVTTLYEVQFDDVLNDALLVPFGELEDDPDIEFSSLAISMDRWIVDEHQFVKMLSTFKDFGIGLTCFTTFANAAGSGTEMLGQRLGALKISGRLLRQMTTYNSVEIIDVGSLGGTDGAIVTIGANLGSLVSRTGGSLSTVDVRGTVEMIDFRGNFDLSAINVQGDRTIYEPGNDLYELEIGVFDALGVPPESWFYEVWRGENLDLYWDPLYDIYPYRLMPDYSNDSQDTAQFISHPSGTFNITGTLDFNQPGGLLRPLVPGTGYVRNREVDTVDYYAMSLKAGQTFMLDMNEEASDLVQAETMMTVVHLYNQYGVWVDSWDLETVEDWGIGSDGVTIEPMIFSAPEAGVYYLEVTSGLFPMAYSYTISNGTAKSLGAVHTIGDFGLNAVSSERGGIGAVKVTGDIGLTDIFAETGSDNATYGSFREGGIVAVEGGTITLSTVVSDSHVGRVASTADGGALDVSIAAGSLVYNDDAHIQNVYSSGDYVEGNTVFATGSIGVIETLGTLQGGVWINANSDRTGPVGNIDLIRVHGDYGAVGTGIPRLEHDEGGNVRFVQVDGEIITQSESTGWLAPQGEISIPTGAPVTLSDDGGGTMTLAPSSVPVVDQDGNQIYVDDDGVQVESGGTPLTQNTIYSYITIPVYVNGFAQSGAGAVIANLRVDGRANIATTGRVEISDMLVNSREFLPEDHGVTLNDQPFTYGGVTLSGQGAGQFDVYYLHDEGVGPLIENDGLVEQQVFTGNWVPYFTNYTNGTIISGKLSGGIGTIYVGGDIGPGQTNSTGAWLPGHDLAPVSPSQITEPQYGWFHGTINGLDIGTTVDDQGGGGGGTTPQVVIDRPALGKLTAAGKIHDLRIIGEAGPIQADVDNLHLKEGNWDGVGGIIWSSERLEYVDVGEGLADDGSGELCEAAIMSTGTIGTVYIDAHGETYSVLPMGDDPNENLKLPKVYGMVNGTIATANAFIELDDEGNRVYRNNIDLVRGVNGATMTANVYSGDLTVFRCDSGGALPGGGIGTVLFTGFGSVIDGSEIHGAWVDRVATDAVADGIFNSTIIGNSAGLSAPNAAVGYVEGGGAGIHNTRIYSNGGRIIAVRGLGNSADLVNCFIESEGGDIELIQARDIKTDLATMTLSTMTISTGAGTAHTVTANRDMFFTTFTCGSVNRVTVGRDLQETTFDVASRIGSITVYGAMIDSIVDLEGPYGSELGSLVVVEDISGSITCAGYIGQIISTTGEIRADIRTVATTEDFSSDVGKIQTEEGYTGTLDLIGSLGSFICYDSLGEDPGNTGITQHFNIFGDLDYLYVWSRAGEPIANLYADISVGGDIGKVMIQGSLMGNIYTNRDLLSLYLGGALGDEITTTQTWTGVDGAPWPGVWSIEGDTDQVASYNIQGNEGRLAGTLVSAGTAFAMAPNACENCIVSVDFNIEDAPPAGPVMGFGLVTRRQDSDPDTYYEASAIPGIQNLGIYRVVDGARTLLLDTGFNVNTDTDYRIEFSTQSSLAGGTDLTVTLWDEFGVQLVTGTVNDNNPALQDVDGRFGMYYDLSGDSYHVDVDNFQATYSRASLNVAGDIYSMTFAQDQDILADLTFGGDLAGITLYNGDIRGDITSRFGTINSIKVVGGNILGDITAESLGYVYAYAANVGGVWQGGTISGDVRATNGDVFGIAVYGGDVTGDVTLDNGMLYNLTVTGIPGTVSELGATSRVYAAAGIYRATFTSADVNGDLASGLDITALQVTGNVTGNIYADMDIYSVNIGGQFSGILRAGSKLSKFAAGSMNNAVVSSGWDAGTVYVLNGNMDNSHVLVGAAYDVGIDGMGGSADDDPLANGGSSGDLAYLYVRGAMNNSLVAAGVNPVDGDYFTTGDNTPALGTSSITRMAVLGGVDGASRILADTLVDPVFAAAYAGNTQVLDDPSVLPPPGWTLINRLNSYNDGALYITLSVGNAYLNPAADTLYLWDTSNLSAMRIYHYGAGASTIDIITDNAPGDLMGDDQGLRSLQAYGNVTIGDVDIAGDVLAMWVNQVEDEAEWNIHGQIINLYVNSALSGLEMNAGEVNAVTVVGNYDDGTNPDPAFLNADAMGYVKVYGTVAADLTTDRGDLLGVFAYGNALSAGRITGDITSQGPMLQLYAADNITGTVRVLNGDMGKVTAARMEGAMIDVDGATTGVAITLGDFGTTLTPNTSYRSGRGIGYFYVSRGDLQGLVSTGGDLNKLYVRGAMKGRVRAFGDIYAAQFGSMSDAILSAGGNLWKMTVAGSLSNGWVMAGFDPGDAGLGAGTEDREITIDIPATETETKLRKIPEPAQEDTVMNGDIRYIFVGGEMGRIINAFGVMEYEGFAIAAGVGPGEDGYIGTADDVVAATGDIGRVIVARGIYGTFDFSQHFGVYAASNEPDVRMFYTQPAEDSGNVGFGTFYAGAGPFEVVEVNQSHDDELTVRFNHSVNFGTVNTLILDPAEPVSYQLLVSPDTIFGDANDESISDDPNAIYNTQLYYDDDIRSIVLMLGNTYDWDAVADRIRDENGLLDTDPVYFQLTITDDVTDNRGHALDGEYYGSMPTGNGVAGGDFVYEFEL